ncbi:MAG: type IV toxin-antitoxin system AbiEi family antitoxin domain-containing protein [Actinomycetia bacterium]|nr:type IV toxin-antitoxin system AbiEi family antitoxin domain-containing protein [Actinomycetes bacterium]
MLTSATTSLLRRQYGVLSRAQAEVHGLTNRQLDRRVASGELVRIHRGVYRHAATASSWHGNLLAACLRYDARASHRAAARLHGVDGFHSDLVEIVVPRGRWRMVDSGVKLHQSTQLKLVSPMVRGGIPVTPLARTVLDLGSVFGVRKLTDVAESVIAADLLQWRHLYTTLAVHSEHGRDGCGRLREVLAAEGWKERVPLSLWSRMVGDLLMVHGLPEPEYEWIVRDPYGEPIAQVDLAYPASKLTIELDSRAWHDGDEPFESDRARIREIQVAGFAVLPLTWEQFLNDGAEFAGQVRAMLDVKSAT